MRKVIDIPEDVYTRLFDNGIQDNEIATDDICEMARSIRLGTPLTEHHGRLIDADALEYTCNADECGMLTGCNHCQYHIVTENEIDNAPTIIEGSDSE